MNDGFEIKSIEPRNGERDMLAEDRGETDGIWAAQAL